MRGGQNRKPTDELKRNGTYRPVYHKNRVSDSAKKETHIKPPAGLSERVLQKWNWVCKKLVENGVLTDSDRDAVLVYSQNWVLWEDCAADVEKNGSVLWVESAGGSKPISNPAFKQMKECETIMRQIWDHFGFTPRARMGLKVEKSENTEKTFFEKLMEEVNADA